MEMEAVRKPRNLVALLMALAAVVALAAWAANAGPATPASAQAAPTIGGAKDNQFTIRRFDGDDMAADGNCLETAESTLFGPEVQGGELRMLTVLTNYANCHLLPQPVPAAADLSAAANDARRANLLEVEQDIIIEVFEIACRAPLNVLDGGNFLDPTKTSLWECEERRVAQETNAAD